MDLVFFSKFLLSSISYAFYVLSWWWPTIAPGCVILLHHCEKHLKIDKIISGQYHKNGLVWDCGNSSTNTLELMQSWNKPLMSSYHINRAVNLQNTSSVFCLKNFLIFDNFFVSLNLFLIRLKTVIMATSYLLWWDPLAPSGNSSGFFRYYRNRKWGRARVTSTCGREKNEFLVIKEVFEGFKA